MTPVARGIPLALLLVATCAAALSTDGQQPISVEADNLEVRDADQVSIYQGNVRLVQGSLEIESDRLEIRFDDEREIVSMRMTGAPARFRQLDDERREMRGEARRIDYAQAESRLEMTGAARFDHAGDTIESERIRIDTETNEIEAGGDNGGERVRMLIQPRRAAE